MDLKETTANSRRHPWERARAKALRRLVEAHCSSGHIKHVLDVGCGDAFLVNELCGGSPVETIHGVDANLSGHTAVQLTRLYPRIEFFQSLAQLPPKRYDLIFLFDVIEHVEDDKVFCAQLIRDHLAPGGFIVMTVPAFRFLWSFHDQFLGHYRRYDRRQVADLASHLGLSHEDSGFFFGSLLWVRVLTGALDRLRGSQRDYSGVGRWQGNGLVTTIVQGVLDLDNALLWQLHRLKIDVAGLSVWSVWHHLKEADP